MVSLSVAGWGWQYAARSTPALSNISFDITPGERVLLLGSSGVGKSTLLRAVAGVLGADEGTQVGEISLDGVSPERARGAVGLVLQDPENQVILERVGDDVAFGCENLGVPAEEIWARVQRALHLVGLNVPLDHSTSKLSGGQKQRLALASVLAMQPELIALDEPTANLDPIGARQLKEALTLVVEDHQPTIVMVEHRVDLWWDFATRVIVLAADGVLWDGAPEDMSPEVRNVLATAGVWLPQTEATARERPAPTGSQPLLHLENLHAAHPGSLHVTTPLDVDVYAGEIVAITGPNGAGKTALALTLGGLYPPRSGQVRAGGSLTGTAHSTKPITWRSRELLSRIGSVFQAPEHQFVAGTVRAELAVGPGALTLSRDEQSARVEKLLDRLHLRDLENAHPFTLSGGQQRRLSVGTVLATQPKVLILDEPTFGQDATTWTEMVALFTELRAEGHAVVIVTHDEKLVQAVADRVIHLGGDA
ncbi:energy-coupling factor transporter ATP-binding protein EcfA2 [Aurantimicrobium minutum]|uniref:ABC transporter ATP-binding protein n=1 Tax=Aurantimicrobium minutum TaxID=708131 RepID=UPI002475D6CF|nr:ABC transporter ATP-binding protein [Aurantimicrobium minutum]MDH6532729.1 energy-coupling factor transporter ATP-binding protein EcfA2 [Aurantimicrobium minutum]